MIRVLHFADFINHDDFIHVVVANCGPEFALTAATLEPRGSLSTAPGGLDVVNLGASGPLSAPFAVLRLRRLLDARRIDIVHAHHYRPNLIAWAASRAHKVRWVIGRHYSDAVYQLSRGVRRRGYLRLEQLCNDAADAIVAPSVAVEAILRAQSVLPAKIHRIPYAFDFRRFDDVKPAALDAYGGSQPGLRIGTFARLHAEKGHRVMIAALQELRRLETRATWLVVGDGPERAALEGEVRAADLRGQVHFVGWRTDVLALMAAVDVVVQPTLHEAFSQVMVEAMALGRPLVISDVSGVRDVVRHGETGFITEAGSNRSIVSSVSLLTDAALRARIGAAARAAVREKLNLAVTIPKFEQLYRQLSSRRPGG